MDTSGESMIRSAQLVVTTHFGEAVLDLNRPVTTIGRSRSATVRLDDDRSVSGKHCEIVRLPAGFLLVDHGSRNGTILRGQEVSEIFLRDGDSFEVGHARIRYVGPDPDEEKIRREPPAVLPAPEKETGGGAAAGAERDDDTRVVHRVHRRRRPARDSGVPLPLFVIGMILAVVGAVAACWSFWRPKGGESGNGPGSGEAPKYAASTTKPPVVEEVRPSPPAAAEAPRTAERPAPAPRAPTKHESKTTVPAVAEEDEKKTPPVTQDAKPEVEEGASPPARAGPGVSPPEPAARGETVVQEAEEPSHEWEYEFMGVTDRGTHVCFVLDASASMGFPPEKGGKIKRDRMKKNLIDAIEDLEPEVSFTIVFFTAEAYAMTGRFVKATAANRNEAVAWVDGFERRGATNLWSGMQRAFEIVRKVPESERTGKEPFHVTMYVLSDGRVRDAQQILGAAAAAMRSAPVTIHTISFDQEDEVLAELAKVGKGEYQVAR